MLSLLDLDPKTTFSRICPGCGMAHTVKNRGRDYCSEKCYQDYYNLFRKKINSLKLVQKDDKTQSKAYISPQRNESAKVLSKNIQLLIDNMTDNKEQVLSINALASLGFDFYAFSYHFPLDKTNLSFCIEYGQFETYLISASSIYIRTKI